MWQTCWCCRDQQRACRMVQGSAEKLEHIGLAEKVRVASVPQRKQFASTPEPPLPKRKGAEHQIVRGERVKVSKSCTSTSGSTERKERARK